MKYTVTHGCGHRVELDLVGKMTERGAKIARLGGDACPACRAAGLPALTGSDKQVAWAWIERVAA